MGRRARAVAIERRRFTYLFPVVRESLKESCQASVLPRRDARRSVWSAARAVSCAGHKTDSHLQVRKPIDRRGRRPVERTGLADVCRVVVERQSLAELILYAGGQRESADGLLETS